MPMHLVRIAPFLSTGPRWMRYRQHDPLKPSRT
jgi:hypothetical protein